MVTSKANRQASNPLDFNSGYLGMCLQDGDVLLPEKLRALLEIRALVALSLETSISFFCGFRVSRQVLFFPVFGLAVFLTMKFKNQNAHSSQDLPFLGLLGLSFAGL